MTVMKMWKVIDIEILALPHESLFFSISGESYYDF